MIRIFAMIVTLLAIIGGTGQLYSWYEKASASENIVQSDEAQGFAAAFLRSYLTYSRGNPEIIRPYTTLPDMRTASNGTATTQRVIEIWPVKTDILRGNHMNVRLTAVVERETDKNNRMTYIADVSVTQGPDGKFEVLQYPRLKRMDKSNGASMPALGKSNTTEAQRVQPMLESFFKTYFSAEKREDLANFFKSVDAVPLPQNRLFTFESITSVEAYEQGDKRFFILVTLKIRDPATSISYGVSYTMQVEENEGKYLILSMSE